MTRHFARCIAVAGFGLAVGFAAVPAQAQVGRANGVATGPIVPSPEKNRKAEPAPPALPGARSDGATPTEPGKSNLEMAPNEALFDAVNRGDVPGARDALSRGADLNARNILGLTPLDLAVDLGRNDVTFLLLSMRGASGVVSAPAKAGKPTGAAAVLDDVGKPAKAVPKPAPAPRMAVTGVAPPKPRQFVSTDPGTPVPQAGFLGFGGRP